MSQSSPRIPAVSPAEFTAEQETLVGDWSAMNFSRVIVNNPDLYRTLVPLIAKLISGSALPPRDREILVLRTLALYDEVYEADHHISIARNAGMNDAEIEAAKIGGPGLSQFDQILIKAADELVRDQTVSDGIWTQLAERYSRPQLMDVVALVGLYTLMAMLTKSFGIELEDAETFNRFSEIRKYK